MSSYKPKDLPDMIPYLVVRDVKKSLDFYKNALGFEVVDSMEDDKGDVQHAEMRRGSVVIMFCPEGAMDITAKSPISNGVEESINLYCYCENVDKFYSNAIANGAKSIMPPEDRFWGDRMCAILDIDHYKWSFATHLALE